MGQKKLLLAIGMILVAILGAVCGYLIATTQKKQAISSYDECVAAGYPIMESYPSRCSTPEGKSFTQDTTTTLEGKIVCLPHKNTGGPQTLECAAGIMTDDGKYYALRSEDPDSSLASEAGSGDRVRVTGTLRQENEDKYQSEGTIQIKSYDLL